MNIWKIFLWIGIAIAAVMLWLKSLNIYQLWEYLFFLRVPILVGLFLISFPLIATKLVPNMLENLFVLRGRWAIGLTIASTAAASMAVVLVGYIILAHGPSRFQIEELPIVAKTIEQLSELPKTLPSPGTCEHIETWEYAVQYILAIVLSLPISIGTIVLAEGNNGKKNQERWLGAVIGIVLAASFFTLFHFTRSHLLNNCQLKRNFIAVISFLTKGKTGGYEDPVTIIASGHLTATAFFLTGMLVYGLIAYIYRPRPIAKRPETPALLYLMLIATVLTLAFGGLTFFFDFYRILPVLFFLVISISSYVLFNVDHFFDLKPLPDKKPDSDLIDFQKVLENRLKFQPKGNRTLIIVCASGGGIQAAAWTAQVLTGLQQWLDEENPGAGEKFAKSIGFISSVSGGSVGSMHYLDRVNLENHFPDPDDFEGIFQAATSDSLDAVGWGLAYPDLWRLLGLPFLTDFLPLNLSDRGKAMETDWQGELKGSEKQEKKVCKSIDTWRTQALKGEIPIPIFNTTIVEDGRRFLISPMTFVSECEKPLPVENREFLDFNTLYGNYDIDIVTAARLSATFSYISPICRGQVVDLEGKRSSSQNVPNYHMADGGYFDNSGIFTMVEWLDKWLDKCEQDKIQNPQTEPGFQKVIFLEINAFPKPQQKLPKDGRGWAMAILGPLKAVFSVRNSTLFSRNSLEIELIQEKEKSKKEQSEESKKEQSKGGIDIHHIPIFFPSSDEAKTHRTKSLELSNKIKNEIKDFAEPETLKEVQDALLEEFESSFFKDGEYQPPLSWKLTETQKQAVKYAWKVITKSPSDKLKCLQELVNDIKA